MPYTDPHAEDHSEDEDSPLIRRLRKQLDEQAKNLKSKDDELEALRSKDRTSTITKFLEDKGAKPTLAKFVEKDVTDVTPESLEKWYKDNAADLGLPLEQDSGSEGEDGEDSGPDQAAVQALQRVQAAQAAGSRGPADIGNDAVLKAAREAASSGSFWEYMESHGLAGPSE